MTAIKKPAIPALMGVSDPVARSILSALKESVEIITGARPGVGIVDRLPAATTDITAIVAKINEIIDRLNAHD